MEELKFTYWLGAGASAKAHPVVGNFTDALLECKKQIQGAQMKPEESKELSDIQNSLSWLASNIDGYTSPDTFAKVAYLKGDISEYNRVKDVLTIFFFIQELWQHEPKRDPRYINFISSLIKRLPPVFPENVKIISWNYDFQVELAANLIRLDQRLEKRSRTFQEPPLIHYYPNTEHNFGDNDYSLIHLNGCAYVFNESGSWNHHFHNFGVSGTESIAQVWRVLKDEKVNPFIHFAWEDKKPYQRIKDHLEQTDILIVIGYSFPVFNRETDKEIFGMITSGNLRKIYVQDPNKYFDHNMLKSQFDLGKYRYNTEYDQTLEAEPDIVRSYQADQFLIPSEY